MSNLFFNGTALPSTKSDLGPVPAGANLANYWTAYDVNLNLSWLAATQQTFETLELDAQFLGAVPDATTDSTSAINAAVAQLVAAGGGVLRLSRGGNNIYRITSQIQIGPKWVNEKDISITTPDPTVVSSYNATLAAAAVGAPVVHIKADPGVILFADWAPSVDTAMISVGTKANQLTPIMVIEGLFFTSQAGMSTGGAWKSGNTLVAPSTNINGIFAALTRVAIRNCQFFAIKRPVVLCSCYWSTLENVYTFWSDRGYVHPGANATHSQSMTHFYAATCATEISGQGFSLVGNWTEECASSLYIPQADTATVSHTYWEASGATLTDYQVKIGDGTQAVVNLHISNSHLTSTYGKSARLYGGGLNLLSLGEGTHWYPATTSGVHTTGNCTVWIAANASVGYDTTSTGVLYYLNELASLSGLRIQNGQRATDGTAGIQMGRGGFGVDPSSVILGFYNDLNTIPNAQIELWSGRIIHSGAMDSHVAHYVASQTLTEGDRFVMADAAAGANTITLPQISTCPGREYVIKRIDNTLANALTIAVHSGDTIEGGGTSMTLTSQFQTVRLLAYSNTNTWVKT